MGKLVLGFRLDSTLNYPNAQALGALQNNHYLYLMGRDMGKQLKSMGIHINFAPVCDINTNPNNPVINFRSFGEDKHMVAAKAWQISKGMQDEGVVPVIKHFPGHGDTQTDSHHTLPVLNHSKERLDSLETFPFKILIDSGVSGVMTAHLYVKALDSVSTPASLSKNVVGKYLAKELGFKGLIVTDAMNMKGVAKPNAELEALKAGNDMLEFVASLKTSISSIKAGIKNKNLDEEEINQKCTKILALKKWCQLDTYAPSDLSNLPTCYSNLLYNATQRTLVASSLTVLSNSQALPIEHLDTIKLATISIGRETISEFQQMVSKYKTADHFALPKNATDSEVSALLDKLKPYNLVVGGIHGIHQYPSGKYGVTAAQQKLVSGISASHKTVLVFFGNAYALKYFDGIENASGLVMAYQDNSLTQNLSAQLLFGALETDAKLPVHVDGRFPLHTGIQLKKNKSLQFGIPEELGISSLFLKQKIDSIAQLGIDSAAFPGCQVLVAKDGKVIFHECYGYYTYQKKQAVNCGNIYDLASLTKIIGPLPALMKLADENRFLLDVPFSTYWEDWKDSDKKGITVRDILAHQGRLKAWIPFWQATKKPNGRLDTKIFKTHPSKNYNLRVCSNLYMNKHYLPHMLEEIKGSPLLSTKKYTYSDMAFYLFPSIIETITGENYEHYLKANFYAPLGASTFTYNAYKHFPKDQAIPTELDDFFRKELLQGFVHDEGAAMMGGVSGNAGLFGSALDLAKIMQMYLQNGYYGGRKYVSARTIEEFTKCQFPENDNRRGLGFDKPYIDNYKNKLIDAFPAVSASELSFGHSGFTGTFAWADPANNLLFIFLSNRVYPTRENSKIYKLNIRTAMHQAIYDSIKQGMK